MYNRQIYICVTGLCICKICSQINPHLHFICLLWSASHVHVKCVYIHMNFHLYSSIFVQYLWIVCTYKYIFMWYIIFWISSSYTERTGWRRYIGCLKLQVSLRKKATNYRALLWKMTCTDKAPYASSPRCSVSYQRLSSVYLINDSAPHSYILCQVWYSVYLLLQAERPAMI